MNNLSFHITDIASNSFRAGATEVEVAIEESREVIVIRITDNGKGMDEATLRRVRNPFYTSRTTRKVGLGLPFLIQNAEQTGGEVKIESVLGEGTTVTATFIAHHIDLPPWGDLSATIAMLMTGNPDVNLRFVYRSEQLDFALSSDEVKEALEDLPISHPQVMGWLREMIEENLKGGG
ncbi:sensor histidine kinase [Parabacteroides sp. OttesenSCG-928-N08]|nr:sensor histidine kinase [Parabacteroides sp. OttesenSCG-928-N08]